MTLCESSGPKLFHIFLVLVPVLRAENKGDSGALFRSLIKYDSSLPEWRVRERRIRRQKCKCPPIKLLTLIVIITIFLAVRCGLWDFSSPTRDRTCVPCSGNLEP